MKPEYDDEHCSKWPGIPQDGLNDDNRLHIEALVKGMATGPWNIRVNWANVNWRYGLGTSFVVTTPGVATHDGDHLTRLVLAAHDLGVRIDVSPCTPKALRISMWTRPDREGSMGRRHPTMETSIKYIRTGRHKRPGKISKILSKFKRAERP